MKLCPNCGSSFDDSMRFCVQCGTVLQDAPVAPVEEAPQAASVPDAPQAVPEAPQAVPEAAQQPFAAEVPPPAPGFVPPYAPPVAPVPDPADHTAEMDPEDIAEHKLYAMLLYLLGPLGIVIALLKNKESKFLQFHIKLSIKYLVVNTLLLLITTILGFTIILGIGGLVCLCIVSVLEIITFVQVCKGQAKDPAIIKSIKFLN